MNTSPRARLLPSALCFLATGLWPLASGALRAAPTPVTSTISNAAVYSDRAVVTRTATIDHLEVGEHELTFENLPSGLIDDSLQVTAHGSAQVTILDSNARNTFVDATTDPHAKELENKLKDLAKERRAYDDQTTVLNQQRDYLLKIQAASTTPVAGTQTVPVTRPGVDDWTKMMEFIVKNLADLNRQTEALDLKREDLQARQTAAEQELNQYRNGGTVTNGTQRILPNRAHNFKTVTVRLDVTKAGGLQLALAYGVIGASWTPSYDARLHTGSEKPAVKLEYFGNVRQNTGEDWKDVHLTLSTARPSLGGGAPELHEWVVDVAQPAPVFASSAKSFSGGTIGGLMSNEAAAAMPAPAAPMAREMADKDMTAAYAVATVESGVTSASYKISDPTTVLSDNAPQKVNINTETLGARLQYQSTPRTVETAFLTAYVTNSGDFPLLAGSMNTFLDDTFIAASSLKTVMPGEKFSLALGADEGISVKRKLVNRYTAKTGIIHDSTLVTYEFNIIVTNNKKTQERFVFKEVLPVTRNDKIDVKLLEPRDLMTLDQVASDSDFPKTGVTKEEDGKIVWREDLKPGEKREFPFKFSVEYPTDFPIIGLE